MKHTFFLCCVLSLAVPANADTLYFETGSRYDERDITWPGRVKALDPALGLITFEYLNDDELVQVRVHTTRIYSIKFDALYRLNRPFPSTRRPLIEPLPSSLTPRDQAIELHNRGFLSDDLPSDLRVLNPDGSFVTIRGAITALDGPVATISGWTKSRSFIRFEVSTDLLKTWVRGL